MNKKYNEIMDRVKVDAEMRERILRGLEQESQEENGSEMLGEDTLVEESRNEEKYKDESLTEGENSEEKRKDGLLTEGENPEEKREIDPQKEVRGSEDEKRKNPGNRKLSFFGRMNKISTVIAAVLALVLIGSGIAFVSLKSGSDITTESAMMAEEPTVEEAAEATDEQADKAEDKATDESVLDLNEALAATNGRISGETGGGAATNGNALAGTDEAAAAAGSASSGSGGAAATNNSAEPALAEGTGELTGSESVGGAGAGGVGTAGIATEGESSEKASTGTSGNTTATDTTAADTTATEEAADTTTDTENDSGGNTVVSLVGGTDLSVRKLIKMVTGNYMEYVRGTNAGTSSAILEAKLAGYDGEISLKWKNNIIESVVWKKLGSGGSLNEFAELIKAEVDEDGKIGENGAYVWRVSGRKIELTPNLMIEITME